jgi:formiminotetrahydrofolate cyclodeaminase
VSLLALSARDLLDRLASTDPTPGGGSAAAWAGATGAALVAMVCAMPKTRTGAGAERERLETARGWSKESGERLRRLVDDDAAAFDAVMAAYRLPKETEDEKARRKEAITAANRHATDVPMRTAEACLVVLAAAHEAASHGNPNALSDARTGAALALAGLLGALENVRINLGPGSPGAAEILERSEAARREGVARARDLGLLPA